MSAAGAITPPSPPYPRAARVYALTPPAIIARAAVPLASALFGMSALEEEERRFAVHPVSGGVSFTDHAELWQNRGGGNLPSDPERAARAFLEEASRRVATDRQLAEAGITSLFPTDLRPRWKGAVIPASGSAPDHLLCQFDGFLPIDATRTARVEGGTIDVRIGRGGRPIALRSRWRPIAGEVSSAQPVDPEGHDGESSGSTFDMRPPEADAIAAPTPPAPPRSNAIATGHDHQSEAPQEPPPEGVFLLNDENAPQTFLAPFWLSVSGHHGGFEPASAHSLYVDVAQKRSGDGTLLAAVVTGGSGKLAYLWSYWSPIDIFDSGLRDAGTGFEAHVPAGSWQVLLRVLDTITGAFAQVERITFGAD